MYRRHIAHIVAPAVALLVTIPLSILPHRWRRRFTGTLSWRAATVVSAAAIALGTLWLSGVLYLDYCEAWQQRQALAVFGKAVTHGEAPIPQGSLMALGLTYYFGFLKSPLGLLVIYLFAESLVRILAAAGADEILGLGVLCLIAAVIALASRWLDDWRQRPTTPDRVCVEHDGARLHIESQRARDWDRQMTLDCHGRLYRLAAHRLGPDTERPFVYVFESLRDAQVIRRLVTYRLEPAD